MSVPNIENNIPNMSVYRRQDCTEEVWEKVAKFDMNNLNPAWSTLQRIPSYDVSEMICENYSDFRVIKGMPKSVFGDQFGYDMQKDIGKCMYDYYAGRISRDEVQVFFQRCCSDMRSYRTKQRQTTGTDQADNQKIAVQIYEVFAKENQRAACRANYAEGKALNGTYGGMQNDWAYYNADYYYMCVDGNQMLRGMLDEIVDKWELPPIDPDEIEANSGFILDGGTKGEIYSLSELLYGDGRVPGSGKDYSRFLSNVTVFTSWYAHHTGMIDRCGNYVPKRD